MAISLGIGDAGSELQTDDDGGDCGKPVEESSTEGVEMSKDCDDCPVWTFRMSGSESEDETNEGGPSPHGSDVFPSSTGN